MEDQQEQPQLQQGLDELDFYSRCSKPLIFNLPDTKVAKSAVNTTTPAPPGVSGTASVPTFVCGQQEDATRPERECKKKAESPPKKKKPPKKLGRTPPTKPLGTVVPHEERTSPTWGSNLINVIDTDMAPDLLEDEAAPFDIGDESFGLLEAIDDIDEFVEEFKKGKMDKSPRKPKKTTPKKRHPSTRIAEPQAAGEGQVEEKEDKEDEEVDLNASQRIEAIKDDAQLVTYFKDQLSQSAAKQRLSTTAQADKSASPARVGIPISTPKPAPSPRRPPSPERLYDEEPEEPSPKKSPDVSLGDLDDDELAELGITKEEAKQLFSSDVFKLPGDEEFDISMEKVDFKKEKTMESMEI